MNQNDTDNSPRRTHSRSFYGDVASVLAYRSVPALKILAVCLFVAYSVGVVGSSAGTLLDPGAAIKARKAHFNELDDAMHAIRKQLGQAHPDFGKISERARFIQLLSHQLSTWFPEGTGQDSGLSTKALSDVWVKPDEFRKAAENFTSQAAALEAVSSQNNVSAAYERFRNVGGSCQTCHNQFRSSWFW